MKKLIAIVVICAYIAAYIAVAVTIGGLLIEAPKWIQLLYFATAGIIWVIPLKPLFNWLKSDEAGS